MIMKKISIMLLLSMLGTLNAYACDVCGCRLGGYYFGLVPKQQSHFIGLRYSYAKFDAKLNYNSDYLEEESSQDTYSRVDIMGRYHINDQWQVDISLPYLYNNMQGSHQNVNSRGVGDPSILLQYQLFNTGDKVLRPWKHALLFGAGVKLPLGNFEKLDKGELINRNFQLGTGSTDFIITGNYTLRKDKIGLTTEVAYKINTENKNGYRFGNQFNSSVQLFYWLDTDIVAILPYAGAYLEYSDYHQEGILRQVNTGGKAIFGSLGTQLFYRNWTLNALYQSPLYQEFNADDFATISSRSRFSIGLIMNFMPKKMILLNEK